MKKKRLPNADLIGREVTTGLSRGKGLKPITATVKSVYQPDPSIVVLSNGRHVRAGAVRYNKVPVLC